MVRPPSNLLVAAFGLLALIQVVCPGGAAADDAAEAQAMFAAGIAALQQDEPAAARVAFERSLELYPTSAAAFNLAGVLTDLGEPLGAHALYEELARGIYGTLTSQQQQEVARLTEETEASLARIEVRVVAEGTVHVSIGDHEGVATESAPFVLHVAPGTYRVRGELEGAPPVEDEVSVAAGSQGRTLLRFGASLAVTPTFGSSPDNPLLGDVDGDENGEDDAEQRSGISPWIWGVLGVVVAGGVVAAVLIATRDSGDEAGTVLPATGTLLSF